LAWKKIANELHIDFTLEHELLKAWAEYALDIILEIGKVEASQEDKTNGWFRKMKNTWRI
jgi:beta-phosphoglucomutase